MQNIFMRVEILSLSCEYIFTLMKFIVNNQEYFQTNSAIHSFNTRNRNHHHRPTANLSCFQKKCILCWHQNFQQSTTKSQMSYTQKGTI